ncbi:hypothetical protein QCD83_20885 [Pseudomonas savastanoi pv. phaseolicola]|uniref:Uncharacterized protein n=3 Tax=Pseudomonas savastanoi TaxID=29438 RepID=A0A3M4N667_PSESG|nr:MULTISPECIES: hypothetical protein [Pseudomonas]AAZ34895.1 hypothetical protein PSPPH_2525 [Pseudomonas savastanoi pv. phaseolicola 1448A]KPB40446.1 Uncharacterized protein AC514_4673 [Pseudomonas savastanoi pv. phaseolicola]KPB48406.1 Uncharacterized protein AC513_2794 [Pseudomonas savastanoi pv. phaseolicola]KPB62171.1 Uncharacterized protein AC508_3542 [Pseudomonas amygdali pv. mellea]KPB65071.1 Uncharacterized protein AC512_5561 [Pseudomonas savastanoi pv. phaseolicola]
MSINAVDSNVDINVSSQESRFNAAVENAEQAASDSEFNDALITQAVTIGIMPRAQEMLNEAQSDDDSE